VENSIFKPQTLSRLSESVFTCHKFEKVFSRLGHSIRIQFNVDSSHWSIARNYFEEHHRVGVDMSGLSLDFENIDRPLVYLQFSLVEHFTKNSLLFFLLFLFQVFYSSDFLSYCCVVGLQIQSLVEISDTLIVIMQKFVCSTLSELNFGRNVNFKCSVASFDGLCVFLNLEAGIG